MFAINQRQNFQQSESGDTPYSTSDTPYRTSHTVNH